MRTLTFVLICVVIAGCDESDPGATCVSKGKALKKIEPLANIVENDKITGRPDCIVHSHATITAYTYDGSTVYEYRNFASSNSACAGIVYDCFGNVLFDWGADQSGWSEYEAGRSSEGDVLWERD